jgi:protein TonB
MHSSLTSLKREQLIGLLFVLALHGAALYGLWSYRIIPSPDEAITLMVNLINPPPPEQPKPEPPKPEPPKPQPPKPRPIDPPPPEHPHLVAEAPVVLPDEPVAYAPPPPPPEPVVEAPPSPPQPVVLSDELSVSCPERSPPEYPSLSMRANEQGKVVLRVELGEDGRVASAAVKTSSGHRRLDEAALNAVRTWRCNLPVRNGVAVRAVALQPFNFILEGR